MIRRLSILFMFVLVLGLFPVIAAAQGGENLLQNPGFEGHYNSYNYNELYRGVVLEFRLADGWNPWYREQQPSDSNLYFRRPEYRPGSYYYNGTMSQQFFTSFGTHEAGFYQQVDGLTPGEEYTFSIAAYIWSSNGGDFYLSEDPTDAHIRVGIDPTGGVNPWASTIVWGDFQSFFDTWRVLSVSTSATGSTATVFVWSGQSWPAIHNDVAWDEAFFGLSGSVPVVAPSPDAAPAVEDFTDVVEPASQPQASPTGVYYTADIDLRMRTRPYGTLLDVIPSGTAIPVLGRSDDGDWVSVTHNGQQGWVASWYGGFTSVFEALPVLPLP